MTPREILFKAKRKDNGEWVEGNYSYREWVNGVKKDIHFIHGATNEFHYYQYEIDPATLSQFTGMYDKEGRRIFENDIVKVSNLTPHESWDYTEVEGCVHWCAGAFEVLGEENEDYTPYVWMHDCIQAYTLVIGNIFDNPEMIEEALNEKHG